MSESTVEIFFYVYFVVFFVVAIGNWLFFRKRDPVFRWRWHARAGVLAGFVVGSYMVVLAALTLRSWAMTLGVLVVIVSIVFLNITRTTICHSCGKTAMPQSLVAATKFCVHCGGPIAPSP